MDELSELKQRCICPNCGEQMNISINGSSQVYVCPICGCTVDAEHQDLESNSACPNCSQILDGNECSYCGYDLGSDFY